MENLRRSLMTIVLLVLISHNVCALPNPSDFLALQEVRKSLKDLPGSNFFSPWDFTSNPCKFSGVTCNNDRVVSLNLGNPLAGAPGLTGRLDVSPSSQLHSGIGNLSALRDFSVVPGKIYGSIPYSLSNLKNLKLCNISRNYFSGEIPASLGQLQSLQILDLSYNRLNGEIPSSIASLPKLKVVILSGNELTGSLPQFVSRALTMLDLSHNNLSGTLVASSFPTTLQYLSLAKNKLDGSVVKALHKLAHLIYLDLSMNMFAGAIPCRVFTYKLMVLQLQRNRFCGQVQPTKMVTIPTVDISYNKLNGSISPMFANVSSLYLNNNLFSGSVPVNISNSLIEGKLKILHLQYNFLNWSEISNQAVELPPGASLCLQYNCMEPPLTNCSLSTEVNERRPEEKCVSRHVPHRL